MKTNDMTNGEGKEAGDASPLPAGTPSEIPFLVTHWLQKFCAAQIGREQPQDAGVRRIGDKAEVTSPSENSQVKRVQVAVAELSEAFSALGSFGQSIAVRFDSAILLAILDDRDRKSPYQICYCQFILDCWIMKLILIPYPLTSRIPSVSTRASPKSIFPECNL